jgi:hypothetical protein
MGLYPDISKEAKTRGDDIWRRPDGTQQPSPDLAFVKPACIRLWLRVYECTA